MKHELEEKKSSIIEILKLQEIFFKFLEEKFPFLAEKKSQKKQMIPILKSNLSGLTHSINNDQFAEPKELKLHELKNYYILSTNAQLKERLTVHELQKIFQFLQLAQELIDENASAINSALFRNIYFFYCISFLLLSLLDTFIFGIFSQKQKIVIAVLSIIMYFLVKRIDNKRLKTNHIQVMLETCENIEQLILDSVPQQEKNLISEKIKILKLKCSLSSRMSSIIRDLSIIGMSCKQQKLMIVSQKEFVPGNFLKLTKEAKEIILDLKTKNTAKYTLNCILIFVFTLVVAFVLHMNFDDSSPNKFLSNKKDPIDFASPAPFCISFGGLLGSFLYFYFTTKEIEKINFLVNRVDHNLNCIREFGQEKILTNPVESLQVKKERSSVLIQKDVIKNKIKAGRKRQYQERFQQSSKWQNLNHLANKIVGFCYDLTSYFRKTLLLSTNKILLSANTQSSEEIKPIFKESKTVSKVKKRAKPKKSNQFAAASTENNESQLLLAPTSSLAVFNTSLVLPERQLDQSQIILNCDDISSTENEVKEETTKVPSTTQLESHTTSELTLSMSRSKQQQNPMRPTVVHRKPASLNPVSTVAKTAEHAGRNVQMKLTREEKHNQYMLKALDTQRALSKQAESQLTVAKSAIYQKDLAILSQQQVITQQYDLINLHFAAAEGQADRAATAESNVSMLYSLYLQAVNQIHHLRNQFNELGIRHSILTHVTGLDVKPVLITTVPSSSMFYPSIPALAPASAPALASTSTPGHDITKNNVDNPSEYRYA